MRTARQVSEREGEHVGASTATVGVLCCCWLLFLMTCWEPSRGLRRWALLANVWLCR